jgi:polygalacturonase
MHVSNSSAVSRLPERRLYTLHVVQACIRCQSYIHDDDYGAIIAVVHGAAHGTVANIHIWKKKLAITSIVTAEPRRPAKQSKALCNDHTDVWQGWLAVSAEPGCAR